jgi:uncharacterized delta-60 repeat protein
LALAPAAHAAGEFDYSFGLGGRVTTDFGGPRDGARGVAIQSDGKIVAAGTACSASTCNEDFGVARYSPNGNPDTSFDGDGRVLTNFPGGTPGDEAFDVAIQADGKIVVAGTSAGDVALARYNADGGLDTAFDGDGLVTTDLGGDDRAEGVAIQADGKIVVAGSGPGQNDFDFALARYNAGGTLDPTFSGDGKVLTDFGDFDFAFRIAIQADGKIVAAGLTEAGANRPDFALSRYNADGSLDATFDADGRVVSDVGGDDNLRDLAIQPDGRVVVAGFNSTASGNNFELARYNSDGGLDTSFDGDGRVVTAFPSGTSFAEAVAIQADGKILAGGGANLARYNSDGSLDAPSFGGDGMVGIASGGVFVRELAIQADGKIVTVGLGGGVNPDNFLVARHLSTGAEPKITVDDVSRLEGNAGLTLFKFTVSIDKRSAEQITVSRQTANGTASAPSDYSAVGPATFVFSPGETTKNVIVKVNGDVALEPNETLFVKLSNPNANATLVDDTGKGTILNDDLSDAVSCTITGTKGNDVLTGTSGNDVICGGRGDDQIYGADGADVLKGEDGNDLLVGGNGVDLLVGGRGIDDLRGEAGNDTLRAGDQGDTMNGGTASDALFGDAGADSLNSQDGVGGNDSADGGADSDSCIFDSGDFVTSCP